MDRPWPLVAATRWRGAMVEGDGAHAVVRHCGTPRVDLYPDAEQAGARWLEIGEQSCGDHCQGNHGTYELQQAPPVAG